MNKRIISMMLVLTMLVGIAQMFAVPTDATATLTITQPYDGEWISYSNSPRLEWNKVDGAAGYRISIRNLGTDELVVDRAWTTKTYYTLKGKLDAAAAEYRIWVGAMYSKNDDNLSSFTSSTITVHTTPEAPEIDDETWEDTTYNSVILSMEITRDNGNAITDSGFYIVESGLPTSDRIKYSFKNNGSYSATTKGYKKMTISGLKADTKYYFWAYAINGVGETITSRHAVTTDEYDCPHTSGVYTNTYPESVSYINTDDSKQHKEIWYYHQYCKYCDKVVKEKAVSETNYGDHEFTDGVCKLCKYEKTNTGPKFNQGPTLTLSIDGNKISDKLYGTYIPGEDVIYFNFTANYSDHVFVEANNPLLTFTTPEGIEFSSGTFVEKTSSSTFTPKSYTNGSAFQIAINISDGIPAGDYTISVTATDGVYDGDSGSIAGTSYYKSVKESVTVRIDTKASGDSEEAERIIPTSVDEANKMVIYSSDNKAKNVVAGKVRHIPQMPSDSFYCADYWKSGAYDTSSKSGSLCTRAVYSMALSYLGIDCTPGEMARLMKTNGEISTVYYDNVTAKLQSTYPGLSTAKSGKLSDLFENYVNDSSYSPVYVRFGAYGDSVGHAALVIGRDTTNPNKYYCVEPSFSGVGDSTVHLVTMIVNNDGTVATDYTWASCRGRSITACYQWQYVKDGVSTHTHSYIEYNYEAEHPHQEYKKCACGEYEYTGKTQTIASCNACFPDTGNDQPHPDCTNGHEFGAWTKNTINDTAPHISLCIKCQYPSYSQHDFYSTADYDGNYHVRNCTLCGAVYEEHDYMYIEGWAASCKDNSTGRKACNQCTLCDRLILNGEQVRQEDLIIYPTHSVQHVEAQNPTCTTDGNIEYWYCTECNQTWLDKDCTLVALSTVSPSSGHVWDSGIVTNGNILYTCTVCHTTQTETAPQNPPTISIESARGSAGNTVTMQVFIENNPGIAFLSLSLQYDQSVLTLASKAINGEIISDLDHGTNLMWTSPYNSNANGLLCTLTFNISSNAVAGNYPISLIFREAYTEDEKKVSFSISNGSVQVFEYIYGDVNGDEIVDGRDVIKLRQYMANYNYDTGISTVAVSAGADANGDGIINGLDVIKLRQYMANYNYDTGSSTVILGPTQ